METMRPEMATRIAREIRELATKPGEGVRYVETAENSLAEIHAEIDGPVDTPFEGGVFRLKLVLGSEFPSAPPRGFFLTKIFHPNIATNGDVCVNTLKKDWKSDVTLGHVFQVIRCLLIVPFPESSLNDEAGKLFMTSYDEYFKRAQLMTQVHALKPRSADPPAKPVSMSLTDKNGDEAAPDTVAAKRKVTKEQKKQKENKKKGLKRL
ncbi:hypothetical protein CTAYLR_000366 [Chrysophaeum taylorii]|uniref:E2 ubiquitin-conjugating enzyme n=1 Tax=Chrysophaeum taylorii TaxID=2483200 RepID=A0AAD7UHJ4_9STRA|nr:hypothetical protein CTAYLR_000366 [Chrysophaeum taylorii]